MSLEEGWELRATCCDVDQGLLRPKQTLPSSLEIEGRSTNNRSASLRSRRA
jgi:hypothetical protein